MKPTLTVPMMARVVLYLSIGILAGCAGRTEHKQDRWSEGYSRSTEFDLDQSTALLESAHQARMEGNYAAAEQTYRRVYDNDGADKEERAQALFGLAETYAALTNPRKDFDQALALYRTLLAEFPGSELRLRAERRIVEIRELIGNQREAE